MSKYNFPTQFECQNRILKVKIRFFDSVRISKNEKRKAKTKSEKRKAKKRKAKHEKRKTKSEKRKSKNENQTNFTLQNSNVKIGF